MTHPAMVFHEIFSGASLAAPANPFPHTGQVFVPSGNPSRPHFVHFMLVPFLSLVVHRYDVVGPARILDAVADLVDPLFRSLHREGDLGVRAVGGDDRDGSGSDQTLKDALLIFRVPHAEKLDTLLVLRNEAGRETDMRRRNEIGRASCRERV